MGFSDIKQSLSVLVLYPYKLARRVMVLSTLRINYIKQPLGSLSDCNITPLKLFL